jgi:hypothetical protein
MQGQLVLFPLLIQPVFSDCRHKHLLLWCQYFATRFPLVVAAQNTFSGQLQTNVEILPNKCHTTHECNLFSKYSVYIPPALDFGRIL